MMPFIRDEFRLNYTQAGGVASAFNLASGFGNLIAGWLSYHLNKRTMIVISISGTALFGIFVGLAPTYVTLLILLVLMGLLSAGYHPAALPLIPATVGPERQSSAVGIHFIGGTGSFFVAPLAAAAISSVWGWRGSFIALAIPVVIFGIAFYPVLRRITEINKIDKGENQPAGDSRPRVPLRQIIAIIAMSEITGTCAYSVTSFITLYLVDHFGVTKQSAAALISVYYGVGMLAGPLGGYLADRIGRIPMILVVCIAAGPILFLLNIAPNMLSVIAVLVLIGLVISMRLPLAESYIVGSVPQRHRSMVLSIFYFAGQETSALIVPFVGSGIDHYGFHTTTSVVCGFMLAFAIICSLVTLGGHKTTPYSNPAI